MNLFHNFVYFVVVFQIFTHNVLSENARASDDSDDANPQNPNGRRSGGILIVDNSGKSDGQRITSHKVETKTYTTRVTSGSAGSGGLHGWVSESQNAGNVVLDPQIQKVVRTQQACGSEGNALTNAGGRTSVIQKKSTVESSQTFNGGNSIGSLTSNENEWQLGQKGVRVGPLGVGQLGDQSSLLHGTSSQITTKKVKDVTGTILTGSTQGLNTVHDGITNIQNQESMFYPETESYKVSIMSSGDGIYANELTGQRDQNLNVLELPGESNSQNIVAVPVVRPQLGKVTVQGYRPNIQYYLEQIENSNMMKNPSAILRMPSFIEHIKPDQININLSEDQLNSYRQYLIQTGLIKLKPYQVIFSDQFRPKLRTLQWMAVPLQSNFEYCKQRCSNLFPRNTLYSTITESASKLPLKLLVPVLKIRSGLKKTIAGVRTITDQDGDVTGMFRKMKDSASQIPGEGKEKSDESNNQS